MQAGAARKGVTLDEQQMKMQEAMLIQHFDGQSDAFYTSGHMLDDGLIDPRQVETLRDRTEAVPGLPGSPRNAGSCP